MKNSTMSAEAVAAYLAARFPGHQFPTALAAWLHRHTDGNALFLVTLVAALVARGVLTERTGPWTLVGELEAVAVEVPEGLRPLLEQQIERLPAEEQQAVAVASVAGVTFTTAAVAAGLETAVALVEARCDALVRLQMLRPAGRETWPDGTMALRYAFVHALYQQAAYERLGVGQRAHVHQRLGARLEQAYGSQVAEVAVELAVHFERSHDVPRAVQYWQQAAENAVRRAAYQEVIGTVRRALALLPLLPSTPERAQRECTLQAALGLALAATQGYGAPEGEQAYVRAWELGLQVGDPTQLCAVLWGLQRLYQGRAAYRTAHQLGEQLLSLAHRHHDSTIFLMAHSALGGTLLLQGQCGEAHDHASQGLALYDPQRHRALTFLYVEEPGVRCHACSGVALWLLGYPDQALTAIHAALALAREPAHSFSLGLVLHWLAFLHMLRREAAAAQEGAQAVMALATGQGFPLWTALGACWHGWALATQGQREAGMRQIRQGIAALDAMGNQAGRPLMLSLLAEAYEYEGQVDEGLRLLTEALAVADRTGEGWWEAELYRRKGELLRRQAAPDLTQAATCFQQALAIAHRQQAKSWELRAAISLARLWQQQGQRVAAHQLLAEVYNWFTEGFDTADLQDAKALLEALA